jgi:predicted MFS family arabinose efflux permease
VAASIGGGANLGAALGAMFAGASGWQWRSTYVAASMCAALCAGLIHLCLQDKAREDREEKSDCLDQP